jgi:4-alpha-glucanotransferase
MTERKSGILLHVTSLPSPFGIGDFGPRSRDFVDFLSDAGQKYWQVLPLNPTEGAYGNSPYSGPSSFAGNPLLVSPEYLKDEGYISKSDLGVKPAFKDGCVNYGVVSEYKSGILKRAFHNAAPELEQEPDFKKFVEDNGHWLNDFALYIAIKLRLKSNTWRDFPQELRERTVDAIESWNRELAPETLYHKFIQYIFFNQWYSLKKYANDKGIRIIGDIPYYVNFDSSEVWNSPETFKLDEEKNPIFVAGVPPDYFSKTGQLWGNPVYDWDKLKETGYSWWMNRIGHNLSMFDYLRLDHFRGFVSYWEVKAGAKSAMKGKWVHLDAENFFDALFERYDKSRFIAEDLGYITPDVKEIIKLYGLPGMKILLFAFGDDFPHGDYLPGNFDKNCVIYTGTHDNNTVIGWWKEEASKKQKSRVREFLEREIDEKNLNWEFIELAMRSAADAAITPMQDVLGLGAGAKMNRPSTSRGNWKWRLRPDEINPDLTQKLRELTEKSDRT